LTRRPIEITFPITEINRIAEKESTGFGRRHYRPVYVMHKWWARRLGSIFRTILLYTLANESLIVWNPMEQKYIKTSRIDNPSHLWQFYSQDVQIPATIVMDPMMGGGTTVVEALRLGCKVIGGDLNPVAWFVVKKEIEDIDPNLLRDVLVQLEKDLGYELRKYYKTNCPICDCKAEAIYYFWVKDLECPDCGSIIPLMKDHFLAKMSNDEDAVVCPNCGDVFRTKSAKISSTCPTCSHRFIAKKTYNMLRGDYLCPSSSCGKKSIVKAIRRKGPPRERIYAIEFYCENCKKEKNTSLRNGRGFKAPDSDDKDLFEQAKAEFIQIESNLPIPDAEIPKGVETRRLMNHGYKRFRDMFNKRQLLNLGKIYKWIMEIEDWNIKEFLILAFSNSLKYNNTFCKYNGTRGFITDIFRTHSFSPSTTPIEANCYDLPRGRGSFTAFANLVIEGKEYCRNPFERAYVGDKMNVSKFKTPIVGHVSEEYKDLENEKNVYLRCGTSEQIDVPDKVADAVVTDPPYYGNVMYSELSNFFYVWIRLALKSRYEHFRSKYAPWRGEVIQSQAQDKGEAQFLEGLTRVFSEANRILKDEGLLVFTFHHKEAEAWGAVLQAVLDSRFFVTAIYPVRSEMKASTHIYEMANIEYDMIIVCRKRTHNESPKSWSSIESTISLTTREMIETLEGSGERPSESDVFVIALGKCLEQYSKHYPNVKHRGKKVTVDQAIESIREIVDAEIVGGRFEALRGKLDEVTAVYLTYVLGRGTRVSYSSMDLLLKPRGFDIDDLLRAGLVSTEGNQIVILSPQERKRFIENTSASNLTAIDKAHYLLVLREEDRLVSEWDAWTDEKALETLEVLGSIQNDSGHRNLVSYLRKKLFQTTLDKDDIK